MTSKIDRMLEAYKRDAEERGKQLLADHMAWKARNETMFPSTLPNARGATSPLGGLCKPATETQAPKTAQPKTGWW
jgi:hypothetical protein